MRQELRNKEKGNMLIRHLKSFYHALDGVCYAFKYEHNMYIILLATALVAGAGIFFQISSIEWIFCILTIGMITAVELINSAIEAVCDLITTEMNPLIKIVKDTAAGASLVLSVSAACIGIMIFAPKIIMLFE